MRCEFIWSYIRCNMQLLMKHRLGAKGRRTRSPCAITRRNRIAHTLLWSLLLYCGDNTSPNFTERPRNPAQPKQHLSAWTLVQGSSSLHRSVANYLTRRMEGLEGPARRSARAAANKVAYSDEASIDELISELEYPGVLAGWLCLHLRIKCSTARGGTAGPPSISPRSQRCSQACQGRPRDPP